MVGKAAAILHQEKPAVKTRCPSKSWIFISDEPVFFYERPCREEGLNEKPDASKKGGF